MLTVTPKQKKVADLVAKRLSNAEIAERLGTTVGSVEQILVKLFKRCEVRTRQELAEKIKSLEVQDRRHGWGN